MEFQEFQELSSVEPAPAPVVKYNERETSGFLGLPRGLSEQTLLLAMAFMFTVPDILSCQTKGALYQRFEPFFQDYIKNQDHWNKRAFKHVTFNRVVYSLSEQSKVLPRKTLGQWEQYDYNDLSLKKDGFGFFSMNKDDPLCSIIWLITQDELDAYLPPDFEHYDDDWALAYF